MNALTKTVALTGLALLPFVTAAQAEDKSMIIDGIMATLTEKDGASVVVLDTVQGGNRGLREDQAKDAASELSGCRATTVTGTAFDSQGQDARPVIVAIRLDC